MSIPAYDSYRPSLSDWAETIPTHWTCKPLWAVAEECDRPNLGMIENNLLSLSYGRIVRKDINDNDGLLPASFETYQIVEPDDVVWRLTDLQNDKRSLRTARVNERGIITSAYLATRPFGIRPAFFAYLLRGYDLMKVFYSMGGGLRQSMKFSDVRRLPILLPPPSEQAAIATFLDRETRKIDALVESQRRLIDLLKEKRQAVIAHAVTKGLSPAAAMKDSGFEWLGEVPAHWTISRLSAEAGFFQGKAHEPYVDEDGEHICVTARFVSTSGQARKMCSMNLSPAKHGDILMVMSDLPNGRALARAHLVADGQSYAVNQRVCAISVRRGDPRFFAYQLNRNKQLLQFNDGVEQTHLKNGAFTKLILAVPPAEEQRTIADQIDFQVAEWDELTNEAEKSVALLQERRTALISSAVTGKIDVRGLVLAQAEAA